jgi:23S rRNA pseudouridine1911/1915/1917 synthase
MTQENLIIPLEYAGQRLDRVLAQLFPQFSRSFLQAALKQGQIKLNDQIVAAKYAVAGEEQLVVDLIEPEKIDNWLPEPIDFDIVYEDDDLLVINKPVGLVVHPGAGNWTGTLVNGLLNYDAKLAQLPRAGIVHRLDKDTSGLMVVAKSREAHHALIKQLQDHAVVREYFALVYGEATAGGTVNAAIARDPRDRLKMAIDETGKPAITHYRIAERLGSFTLLRVILETGRTHQIRLHLASIHHPIVGDQIYGRGLRLPKQASSELVDALKKFKHQALHAGRLSFVHPISEQTVNFTAPLPEDFVKLIELMKL